MNFQVPSARRYQSRDEQKRSVLAVKNLSFSMTNVIYGLLPSLSFGQKLLVLASSLLCGAAKIAKSTHERFVARAGFFRVDMNPPN